jgi:hypothetical protein
MAQEKITVDNNTLLKDAYEGTGGFQDGSYLAQHKREYTTNYQVRQSLCYFLNYLQPIVNAHVNPLFRSPPTRNWAGKAAGTNDGITNTTQLISVSSTGVVTSAGTGTSSAYWDAFVNDVDMHGTNLSSFMKRAAQAAKLYGVCFIVCDNVPDQPATQALALQSRAFPYAYIVEKPRITSSSIDRAGRLVSITYSENFNPVVVSSKPGDQQYRTWTLQDTFLSDKDGLPLSEGSNKVTHGLGILPVIPLYARLPVPGNVLPESEFLSIARTNLRLFNLCSELDELLRGQAFSILCYPGKDASSLTLGPNNALGFDGVESRFAPSFIAPAAAPADWLLKLTDKLVTEMYRMALLSYTTSSAQAEQRTGASKAWDFENTNQVLADFASNCQLTEFNLARVFQGWTKQDLQFSCVYSNDFSVEDIMSELAQLKTAKEIVPFGLAVIAIMKKATAKILHDVDAAQLTAILADLDANGAAYLAQEDAPATGTTPKAGETSTNTPINNAPGSANSTSI